MMIKIPKRIRRKLTSRASQYYHYELVKVYKHIVVYKCIETGTLESFSKNEFVTEREI